MLTCRLRVSSLFTLLTGKRVDISVKTSPALFNRCNAGRNDPINSASMRGIFYVRSLANSELQGVGPVRWMKRSSHSSSAPDDDFAELGSPVGKGAHVILKLMTEKPEPFGETDSSKKFSLASPPLVEGSTGLKDASLKTGASSFENSSSITIKNVPSIINLSQLKEAILTFGKISKASTRTVPNSLDSCDIEFESVESRRRAISAGRITVKNFALPIYPLQGTDDSSANSLFLSESPLRKDDDTLESLLSVLDTTDNLSTPKESNSTIIDNRKWLASSQNREATPVEMTSSDNSDSENQMELEISSQIADLKCKIIEKRVYVQDLEYLHQSILHLQNHPLQ